MLDLVYRIFVREWQGKRGLVQHEISLLVLWVHQLIFGRGGAARKLQPHNPRSRYIDSPRGASS